jgi:hypothetical protein
VEVKDVLEDVIKKGEELPIMSYWDALKAFVSHYWIFYTIIAIIYVLICIIGYKRMRDRENFFELSYALPLPIIIFTLFLAALLQVKHNDVLINDWDQTIVQPYLEKNVPFQEAKIDSIEESTGKSKYKIIKFKYNGKEYTVNKYDDFVRESTKGYSYIKFRFLEKDLGNGYKGPILNPTLYLTDNYQNEEWDVK